MSDTLLRMYHRLPAPMRTMAATARGLYLRRWRYSRRTETLVREASDRERWSSAQWKVWQVSRLVELLDTAATSVPYYREHWRERRAQGDRSSWHELANWPILDKEVLRCAPARFIADGRDRRRLFREHTSGTTGTPIDLVSSPVHGTRALCIVRAPRTEMVRRIGARSVGDPRRATRLARSTAAAAVLGLEPRPQPAVHVVLSSRAGARSALPRRACTAIASATSGVTPLRCMRSRAKRSRWAGATCGWQWRSRMPNRSSRISVKRSSARSNAQYVRPTGWRNSSRRRANAKPDGSTVAGGRCCRSPFRH